MDPKQRGTTFQSLLAIICIIGILPGDTLAYMRPPQQAATPTSTSQTQSAKIRLTSWILSSRPLLFTQIHC